MPFSTLLYLTLILPIILLLCLFLPGKERNVFILGTSIVLYGWMDMRGIFVVCGIWIAAWLLGSIISKAKAKRMRQFLLFVSVVINVSFLCLFKYTSLIMPIGLSFITFSSLSYIIDVYKGITKPADVFQVGFFVFMFPKVTMGPIVRYGDIAEKLTNPDRRLSFENVSAGMIRFVLGLSKKLIFANAFALYVDYIYGGSDYSSISVLTAWTCSVFYTLQIYYDFSGYSDMAIGMAQMLGFSMKENFNYPYWAGSIKDFWDRWHISLSTWFRDYVYFPLGGSRVGKLRMIFNLLVVWTLTGIWHGEGLNFIAWGLFYFLLLTLEKLLKIKEKLKAVWQRGIYRIFTLLMVNFGWVLFRAGSLSSALNFIMSMFGIHRNPLYDYQVLFIIKDYSILLVFAFLLAVPLLKGIKNRIKSKRMLNVLEILKLPVVLCLLLMCIACCLTGTYNPFIYQNF